MILSKAAHPFLPRSGLVELNLNLGPEAVGSLYLVCARDLLVPRVRAVMEPLEAEFRRVKNARFFTPWPV